MFASANRTDSGPVLVAGATGRTGRRIVACLVQRGVPVTAMVRDPGRARALPPQARQVTGDVLRRETLPDAVAGARAVIVATCGSGHHDNSAELVDFLGTQSLVRAAAAAGVQLVVYISSIHATRPEHYQDVEPESLGWKARGEEVVRASGVEYCIIRAGWLTDDPGGAPLAVSQGDIAEGHLSRDDLADVCVRVLSLADARGKTIDVVTAHDREGVDLETAVTELQPDPAHVS